MMIKYLCPHWGQEQLPPPAFLSKVIRAGYDGIEINPCGLLQKQDWIAAIKAVKEAHPDFFIVAQMVLEDRFHNPSHFLKEMLLQLEVLLKFEPNFINSHTGKDYFSFKDNGNLIKAAENFSIQHQVKIFHETHRGRFAFAAHIMPAYLKKYPEMGLVADYSHWCAVSESMLTHQSKTLLKVLPHVEHIHARVGWEHGPQIADPFSRNAKPYLNIFLNWWRNILRFRKECGAKVSTICLEAGPMPYMPQLSNGQPLANQWQVNKKMLNYLRNDFQSI